jgi:hypothetical protein
MMVRYVTAAASVRTVDLGEVVVVLDARSGQVQALADPAGRAWMALAEHSDVHEAAGASGLAAADIVGLVAELTALGLLSTVDYPQPWPAPAAASSSRSSWGTRTVPVRLDTPATAQSRSCVGARTALALTLAVRQAGHAGRSFGRLVTLTEWSTRRAVRPATPTEATDAVHAVRRAARHWPARVACLEESIGATLLLGIRGRWVTWCHGVAADPIHLHAWIEAGGHPVAEPDSTEHYTPLLRIPAARPDQEDRNG